MSWRGYARAVADALSGLGYGAVASRLRACGTTATVRTCLSCGDGHASVTVNAGCSVRCCPWCARRESAERGRLVAAAVERVPGYVSTRRSGHLVELERRAAELLTRRQTARAVAELASVRRAIHATRAAAPGRAGWSWRLVTISPAWDPSSEDAYSVSALRTRVADVRERWRRVWSGGADAEGLAAAYLRIEMSEKGHIHAHVLHFGPWLSSAWVARLAGCFVDVRALDGDGVREAVKYAVKAPSALRGGWVGGASTATVIHPELAARYVVATRGRRLAEPYGIMRDAISAAQVCEAPETPAAPSCASCGSCDLSPARTERTVDIAVQLGPRWTWHATDRPGGVRLAPRVALGRVLPRM